MKVLIASDICATVCQGRVYLASQHFYIIKRYYEAFGSLTLCSRVIRQTVNENFIDASAIIDRFIEIDSLLQSFSPVMLKKIQPTIDEYDLVIARMHSIIGMRILNYAEKRGKKCFAEVMGDAWNAYWNHSIFGKMVTPLVFLQTQKAIWNADYALYVTTDFLQKKYPCKNSNVGVSDVIIGKPDETILQNRLVKISNTDCSRLVLMTTGAADVWYKGQQYVIKAIPQLNKVGIRIKYLIVGGGDQSHLEKIARKYGVEEQVEFIGRLCHSEVYSYLDKVDIYIHPSLQEGLPRSVVEAMSRGCPIIGARTGGIPELLSADCVVKRRSVAGITKAIIRIATREKMGGLARRNFEKANEFQDSVLSRRRNAYYQKVLEEINEDD